MFGDKNPEPIGVVGQLLDKVAKVKLRGGVVGKLSLVMMIAAGSMAVMAWVASNVWVSGGMGLLLFLLVLILGLRLVNFADKNPRAALFEGAELLLHEQLTIGMKGLPQIAVDLADLTTDPLKSPIVLTETDESLTVEETLEDGK